MSRQFFAKPRSPEGIKPAEVDAVRQKNTGPPGFKAPLEDGGRGSPRGCGGEPSRSRRTDSTSGRPLLPYDDRAAIGPALESESPQGDEDIVYSPGPVSKKAASPRSRPAGV